MEHVLAVEDSPTQAELLRSILSGAGFEVSLARNGADALQALSEKEVDIVVSDIVMPVMDGYELCRAVKQSAATADLPVILLTSLTDPMEVVKGLESGADNFLRKPYQPDQLVGRIRGALRNRQLRSTGGEDTAIRLSFLDREFEIDADRSQMLDLLVSTFDELVAASRDVRAREADLRQAHAELQRHHDAVDLERNRLQAVVEAVPVPLFVLGPAGTVTHVCAAGAHTLGTTVEEIRGRRLDDVLCFVDPDGATIDPELLPHHRAQELGEPVRLGAAFDVFLSQGDGTRVPVVLEASPVLDERGRPSGSVGTAHVLGALTQHDPVTGLPNTVAYLERASVLLGSPAGDAAMLRLEVDRFDVIRAAFGHEATNQVLVEVSRRLREAFAPTSGSAPRGESFLASLGGNQFGVLLANLPDSFGVLQMAEAARRAVAGCETAHDGLRLTASVGVALAAGTEDSSQLFAATNEALRRARESGGDRVELFGHQASQQALDRLQLEVDLRNAVDREEVELHYQPEVDLATGELLGFEALARWRTEERGPVRPDVFITLAEESGLILPLGRQLLRRACAEASTWPTRAGGAPLSVAVNVSAVQLRPEIVPEVLGVLEETGLPASRLVVEVTETAAITAPDALPLLEELRGHGVRIALDDFGTGYSSMALLTRVQLDQLKLDRGFVAGIQAGGKDAIVARSIVALGEALGVPVLAEGVETEVQADYLRRLGCAQAQGYLFARPMPPAEVAEHLAGPAAPGQAAAEPSHP